MNEKKQSISQPPTTYTQDMLDVNTEYTISINPDDSHQFTGGTPNKSPYDRLYHVIRYIQNTHMVKLDKQTHYKLYPEISLPKADNKTGICRIHVHGTIKFKTYEALYVFYMYILNNLKAVATVEIDTISCKETWSNYTKKNKKPMQVLCKEHDVPYPITNKTSYMISGIEKITVEPPTTRNTPHLDK